MPLILPVQKSEWTRVTGNNETIALTSGTSYEVDITNGGYLTLQLPAAPADGTTIKSRSIKSAGFLEFAPGTGDSIDYGAINAKRGVVNFSRRNEIVELTYHAGTWLQSVSVLPKIAYRSSVLLNFEGANGSTTITDSSSAGANPICTRAGTATIGTNRSKFGGSSLSLPGGTGSGVSIADNAAIELAGNDFTIDFWLFLTAIPGSGGIMGKGSGSTSTFPLNWGFGTGYHTVTFGATNETSYALQMPRLQTNAWTHLAVCRSGSVLKGFLNGNQVATTTLPDGAAFFADVVGSWQLGYLNALTGITGSMDCFRMVIGSGLFTTDFEPWNYAYPL